MTEIQIQDIVPPMHVPEKHEGEDLRVLVVDDERMIRSLFQMTLEMVWGCTVFAVSTADEATAFLQTTEVDLILCDFRLPGAMDGDGILRRAMKLQPKAYRVLMSGSDIDTLGRKESAHRFLYKGGNPRGELESAVVEAVRVKRGG